jgi:hypothetical protein
MAPKKKQRVSRGGAADSAARVVGGTPLSIHAISPVLLKVRDTVDAIYKLRHRTEADSNPETDMGWPVLWGGSFKDICERFWNDPESGLNNMLNVCKMCGVMSDTDTCDELGMKFMHLPDPGLEDTKAVIHQLSILAFSFADESFIRGKSGLPVIMAYCLLLMTPFRAKSII